MSHVLTPFVNKISEFIEGEISMLWGVKGDLQKLIQTLKAVGTVLEEAEKRSIQEGGLVKQWLDKLTDVMYDADDIADLCLIEINRGRHAVLLEHRLLACSPTKCLSTLKFGYSVGKQIRKLNKKLESINKERMDFHLEKVANTTTNQLGVASLDFEASHLVSPDTVGLDDETKKLVDTLHDESWYVNSRKFTVFAIIGTGGIGKSTLAQKVYNEPRIKDRYQLQIWLAVSRNYSVPILLKEMIRWSGGDHGQCQSKAELEALLIPLLSGKKIFLVLDNVWNAKVWEDGIRNVLESSEAVRGSAVLVTTRKDAVPLGMHAVHSHRMKLLSTDNGWALLCKKLELQEEGMVAGDLKEIGMEFVRKCHGLPLAIKAVAGVLNMRPKLDSEWRNVLQNSTWFARGQLPEEVMKPLYLSYQDLPSHFKECFLYLSLFPEGFSYMKKDLARLWVAEGYVKPQGTALLEDLAEECYEQLVRRNILQPDPQYIEANSCTIHDLFWELADFLSGRESCYKSTTNVPNNTLQGLSSGPIAAIKLRRLSLYSPNTEVLDLPSKEYEPKCLRTLILHNPMQIKVIDKHLFKKLKSLRVLDLTSTRIERLPDSLHHLIHLRLLDLSRTGVKELPESIGQLCILQTLDLSYCESLSSLPRSIAQLRSLRCLRIIGTPLTHLPPGIKNLGQLNHLEVFVVGEQQSQQEVCGLEELGNLSQLRILCICQLEKALNGVSVLAEKRHLRHLSLDCTASKVTVTPDEMNKIEQTFDGLSPPSCLESLDISNYYGRQAPSWMVSSPLSTSFPRLTKLCLHNCSSWHTLPSLGQLLNLGYLEIYGASSIVSIGPEFEGFSVLEILKIVEMPNWEEWSSTGNEWMPRLKKLGLYQCPKLKALPEGLRYAKVLELLHIEGADELNSIQDLSASSPKTMQLLNNRNLVRISNIPAVMDLVIRNCNSLDYVENLNGLQHLVLEDSSLLCLTEWLEKLIQLQGLQRLWFDCQYDMFLRCIENAEHWDSLKQISILSVVINHGRQAYLNYTKTPYSYECSLLLV